MPIPASRMLMNAVSTPTSSRMLISMGPPSGLYLMALPMRLLSTCSMRRGSTGAMRCFTSVETERVWRSVVIWRRVTTRCTRATRSVGSTNNVNRPACRRVTSSRSSVSSTRRVVGWSKRLAIRAVQANVVGGEKVQHRLTGVPGSSPDGGRGTIGQHEAGFLSLHNIDAGGQFIQNQLQDRQACFGCLSGRTLALFQATALGDITNGAQHVQRVIERERAQADIHWELRAIFATTIQLQPRSHRTGARRGGITLTMESVGSMKAFRQKDFQFLPDEFGARVAKQRFHLAIHERDTSGSIDHDQRIGRDVQQREEGRPASLPLQGEARRTWRMK